MAKKTLDIDALNSTLFELPEGFEDWCKRFLPNVSIYYRRDKDGAECMCGICAEEYHTNDTPIRYEMGKCPYCGHRGKYEWKKVYKGRYYSEDVYLVQKTTDNNLVCRVFTVSQYYQQYRKAEIEIREHTRYFLYMGDAYKINYVGHYRYQTNRYEYEWTTSGPAAVRENGRMHPGYQDVIKESNLKYCDLDALEKIMSPKFGANSFERLQILVAYANNPAIEMYAKMGMDKLVREMIYRGGKIGLVHRRGKSMKSQLRLRDKQLINKLIQKQGNPALLKILQYEQKHNVRYSQEQEEFICEMFKYYGAEKCLKQCLKYMSVQQLMNRIEKYRTEDKYPITINGALNRYADYLGMREELGYDMTNEVFTHPKNLNQKHAEMVKEKNARADELYIAQKLKQYPDIAKQYKKWDKKYHYEEDGWIIRPAKNAAEIVMEGRKMHHCVGRDYYISSHNAGKSIILFLRKSNAPEKPYCTIEIKDKKIVQWYEANDKKPHKDIIDPLLERFVEQIGQSKKKNETVTNGRKLSAAV